MDNNFVAYNQDLLGESFVIQNQDFLFVRNNSENVQNNSPGIIEEENNLDDLIDLGYNEHLEDEEIQDVDNYQYEPFPPFQRVLLSREQVRLRINNFASNYLYPNNVNLQWIKNYFCDVEEHKHLTSFNYQGEIPFFRFNFDQGHYNIPEERDEMYKLLYSLNFHSDINITKERLENHEVLAQDFFGQRIHLSKIPKNLLPTPKKLYYCDNHWMEGVFVGYQEKKSTDFKFYQQPHCTICNKDLDYWDYILIYDAKEAVSFHLFVQDEEEIDDLIHYNIEQNRMKGTPFEQDTNLGDFNSGFLVHVAREKNYYSGSDISLATLFNFDAVNTKRKANLFKDVTPFFLLNCNLPINKRFKRENLILLGFYCGKKKGKVIYYLKDIIILIIIFSFYISIGSIC